MNTRRLKLPAGMTWSLLAFVAVMLLYERRESASAQEAESACGIPTVRFNALDYRQTLFDFASGELRESRHIDADYRDYPGDLLFDGTHFVLLDTLDRSGFLIDLGKQSQPDSEFSLFYGLRQYKRHLQKNRFPHCDDYEPFPGVDRDLFFGRPVDGFQKQRVQVGHTYLLRLAHRTRIGDEEVFVLRIIDFVPGVRATMQWRDLPNEI